MQHYTTNVTCSQRQAAAVTGSRDGQTVRSVTSGMVGGAEPGVLGDGCAVWNGSSKTRTTALAAGLRNMLATAMMFRNARCGDDAPESVS
jgi:tetrahydromethanopterin S-methyltransferase subunit D